MTEPEEDPRDARDDTLDDVPDRELAIRALAAAISEGVRTLRLERIGEDPDTPHVRFDELPADDRQNWHDVAEVVYDLIQVAKT